MKLVYHIGLHSTDEDRALHCLLKNADALLASGTVVASPGRFRPVLRQAMIHLQGAPASREIQEQILDSVMQADSAQRLVFSSDSFLCVPKRAITGGTLYPLAAERAPWIRNLFPDGPAEFAFAIRNPATLIPALQTRFQEEESFESFLARIQPEELSWTDMVVRLRDAVPDCPLTLWCNEDTPMIWPEILQTLSGLPEPLTLDGMHDFYGEIMSEEGVVRMVAELDIAPHDDPGMRRDIVTRCLAECSRPEAVEVEYDLPGWTSDRIARLSERYEADVSEIKEMEGVRFLGA